jgi:hypothetical protein
MILIILTLLAGLSLSTTAAYYSIVGLIALFPGAVTAIIAMGATLEFSKLVAVSWLYRNWSIAPVFVKSYMMIAIFLLMFITSMGIFGFLSKSHIEQTTLSTSSIDAKIDSIDAKIASKEKTISRVEKQISILDSALDRYIELGSVTKGIEQRKLLEGDIAKLESDRINGENELVELKSSKALLLSEQKNKEAEIGPLKYIAQLVYGDNPTTDNFDTAVRWVIILLVIVFDPLAIMLMIAFNISLKQREVKQIDPVVEEVYNDENPQYGMDLETEQSVSEKTNDRKDVVIDGWLPAEGWLPSVLKRK